MKFKFSALLIALTFFSVQIAVADTYILDASNTPLESPIIADDGETNAIVSSGSSTTRVNGTMTVIGDSTINNTNRLELHAAITADYPYTITKVGGGQLLFLNDSSAVGKIVITAGQVVAQGNANAVNAINGVELNGGSLQIWNLQNVTGHIYANGGTFQSAGGNNSFIGDITQNAEMSIDVTGSYTFTTTGSIGGPNADSVYRINKTNSGTWNIQGPVNVGYFDMAGGTVNVQAGGSVQGTQLVLRQANGTDTYTFTVDGGSATFTGDDHRLGHWANHVGVLNIKSGSFRADNTMTVGWDGTGKLYQTGGTAQFGTIATRGTGSLIEFSGGTTTIGTLKIGQRGDGSQGAAGSVTFKGTSDVSLTDMFAYHTGTINIEDSATVTVNNNAYFCQAANAGDITINQSGGTFTVNGNMALGHYSKAMVTYNMTGGELSVPNYDASQGQSGFWFAVDGSGTLNQSGGTINAGRMNLNARDAQQVGTYVMTGGTLNVGTGGIMATQNGAERYVIQLEKGTITAGAESLTANVGSWSSDLNMMLTGTGDNRVTFKPEEYYTITLTGLLYGTGGLIKDGEGTLVLNPAASTNTYTGDTTVKAGTLTLVRVGATGTLAPESKIIVDGSTAVLAGHGDFLGYTTGAVGSITLQNGGTFANDSTDAHITVNNAIYMNNGYITAEGDGHETVGNFYFDNAIHVTGGTDNEISAPRFTLRALNNTVFADGDFAGMIDVAEGAKLTVSSVIVNNTSAPLTKTGKGELVLTNANAFNKDLIVNGGVLDLTEGKVYSGGYYSAPNVYINEGGTLKVNNFGYSEGGRASLGGLTYQSNGSYNVHFNGGTIQITEAFAETIGRRIEMQEKGGTFDIAQDVTVTLSQDITGTGALIKDGAGTLELNYNNTYTGGTTVKNGTLRLLAIGGTGSLAAGSDVVVDGYNSVLAGTGDIIGYKVGAI
ncbi:MAG: autotransporter-associated beta strand repeat-containing protein, partial [Thermoguttaceae bacterium]|nr:autotransporter-associated beta strand repeat-containing protein [Thermoguttaceae bacterium]